ncbi:hypothetical protein [Kitasatospora sp. NPDC018619]|uniref:hypothetical protein n=1 Tax=unclassified Kitasatospora TaxID=2633591 RepID=UPI0037BA76D9
MSTRTSRTLTAIVAAATATVLAAGAAPAATVPSPGGFTIEAPPTEPGTYSRELLATNSNGDSVSEVIVGDYGSGGPFRISLLLWKADWSMNTLVPLPGDSRTGAAAINNDCVVVGTSGGHAVRWTSPSTPVELLPLPGDTSAAPAAIGGDGTAVGTSSNASPKHAVAWPPNGAPIALPPLPGDAESVAVAVNGSGTAVGYSYPAGDVSSPRAAVWGADGAVTALGLPAGLTRGGATRITDTGIGIGWASDSSGPNHAVVWNASGTVADLGPATTATAVNNAGTVVGDQNGQAARWDADGTPRPLQPTALASHATGINDQGTVVGYTSDPPPARAQLYAQLWAPDGSVSALPPWSPDFPYAMPSAVSNTGIVTGSLLLRGLAHYGLPFSMRWKP